MKFIIKGKNKQVAANCQKELHNWFNAGKDFVVEFKHHKNKRSNQQNRYLWGVVYALIAEELGYSVDEIHDLLAKKFIPSHEIEVFGESRIVAKSTAKLSTIEFSNYVESIRAFVAEYGIVIPDPDPEVFNVSESSA